MHLNTYQRLFLSGVVSGADVPLRTAGAILRLLEQEGRPSLEYEERLGTAAIRSLLDELQRQLASLSVAWALDDRRIAHLPALVQAQRLRTGLTGLGSLRPETVTEAERPLARQLAAFSIEAGALENAVLNGRWSLRRHDAAPA